MGLTIHYSLSTKLTKPKDIRRLVEALRESALDLALKEVGEVKELTGAATDFRTADEVFKWMAIQATGTVAQGNIHYDVMPKHIIAFSTWPGEGSEAANFGFCKYPGFITPHGTARRMATKLSGWRWHSFCKTQYASSPECGGVENFLRCHLSVVKMLDFIKATGLVNVEVSDEGGYWDHRDLKKLAKEVGEWNEQMAGFVSIVRAAADGKAVEAPITSFANFEHLEAKGLEKLADLKRAFDEQGMQ